MPIYEYQCQNCGHQLEKLQKISDEPLKICPNCNKTELQKLVSASGFQLKGSGWYVTDFRDGGKKSTSKKEDNASTNASSTDSSVDNKTSEKPSIKTEDSSKKPSSNTD